MTQELICAILALLFGACQSGCIMRTTIQMDLAQDGHTSQTSQLTSEN